MEIAAERLAGERVIHRLVSVRGWPSPLYTRGSLAGQPRGTPGSDARGWIAQAVLDLALGRGADLMATRAWRCRRWRATSAICNGCAGSWPRARVSVYLVAQEGPGDGHAARRAAGQRHGAPPAPRMPGQRRKLGLPGASRLHLPCCTRW